MGLITLLKEGGITIWVLIACSVLSLTIIIERLIYFALASRTSRQEFMALINSNIKNNQVEQALEVSRKAQMPFAKVVLSGLESFRFMPQAMVSSMQRQVVIETNKLEQHLSITGTIGSVAVYIGLFGTVLGIIRAFRDISASGSGGITVVVNGIAEALICTAAGLVVAVPAVIFYNYFVKQVDNFVMDMELCASELEDLVKVSPVEVR